MESKEYNEKILFWYFVTKNKLSFSLNSLDSILLNLESEKSAITILFLNLYKNILLSIWINLLKMWPNSILSITSKYFLFIIKSSYPSVLSQGQFLLLLK